MNTTPTTSNYAICWFSDRPADALCECRRPYRNEYGYDGYCMVCALGRGLYERAGEPEPVSGLIMLGLSAAADDPYIVVPTALRNTAPLPLANVEKVVASVVKTLGSEEADVRNRAIAVLAATTNSWPTLNPSALLQHRHGTSLLAADQVRRWLLLVLKLSRSRGQEPTALTILEKLRTADFRDLYPNIESNLKLMSCSNIVTRVRAVFDTMQDFYPTMSPMVNEHCELMVYEQYANRSVARSEGAGATMERLYGPLMKHSPVLGKLLKKGTWLANQNRYAEWYRGEAEPL